jgi:hypothetical protein
MGAPAGVPVQPGHAQLATSGLEVAVQQMWSRCAIAGAKHQFVRVVSSGQPCEGRPFRVRRVKEVPRCTPLGSSWASETELVEERDVGLGNSSNATSLIIHYRNAVYIVLLHYLLALIQIIVGPAGYGIAAQIIAYRGRFRISALGDDTPAQIALRNHALKIAPVLIGNHRQRTHVLFAHKPRSVLCGVGYQATPWISGHQISYFHKNAP